MKLHPANIFAVNKSLILTRRAVGHALCARWNLKHLAVPVKGRERAGQSGKDFRIRRFRC